MRRYYLIPFALVAAAALAQEDEEPASDIAAPEILAFTVTDGAMPSKELESAVGRLRATYDEKPVLFLTINLASAGSRNQASMLFFSLGLGPIFEECKKTPAQLVFVNLDTVTVLGKVGPKDNIAAALDKYLETDEEGGDDGGGCSDGCGDGCGG